MWLRIGSPDVSQSVRPPARQPASRSVGRSVSRMGHNSSVRSVSSVYPNGSRQSVSQFSQSVFTIQSVSVSDGSTVQSGQFLGWAIDGPQQFSQFSLPEWVTTVGSVQHAPPSCEKIPSPCFHSAVKWYPTCAVWVVVMS